VSLGACESDRRGRKAEETTERLAGEPIERSERAACGRADSYLLVLGVRRRRRSYRPRCEGRSEGAKERAAPVGSGRGSARRADRERRRAERERSERLVPRHRPNEVCVAPRMERRPMVGVKDEPQASEACRQLRATKWCEAAMSRARCERRERYEERRNELVAVSSGDKKYRANGRAKRGLFDRFRPSEASFSVNAVNGKCGRKYFLFPRSRSAESGLKTGAFR
jgi:hypothetical protein